MPGSVVAAVLLLAAMTPGYAFHWAHRRFVPRDARSATLEVVELFSIGTASTCIAAACVLGIGEGAPGLVSLRTLAADPGTDFRERPWPWVAFFAATLLASVAVSVAAGWYRGSRSARRTGRGRLEGDAVTQALTARSRQGRKPHLAVELADGRVLHGTLVAVTVDPDPARRDLVLGRPLTWSGPGDVPPVKSSAHAVVVTGAQVRTIHIRYGDAAAPAGPPPATS